MKKIRPVQTIVLSLVLLGCLVYLLNGVSWTGGRRKVHHNPLPFKDTQSLVPEEYDGPTLKIYFFHRTQRTEADMQLEDFIWKALDSEFSDEFRTGQFIWLPTNMEQPENTHFQTAYQLSDCALIISTQESDGRERWVKANRIWTLMDNWDAFTIYVQKEVIRFLGDSG